MEMWLSRISIRESHKFQVRYNKVNVGFSDSSAVQMDRQDMCEGSKCGKVGGKPEIVLVEARSLKAQMVHFCSEWQGSLSRQRQNLRQTSTQT